MSTRSLLLFFSLGSGLAGCIDPPPPEPPEPPETPRDEAPSEEAKADFARAVALYERESGSDALGPEACRSVTDAFEKVYEEHPTLPLAYFNAAVVWEECGEPERARAIYEALAKRNYPLALNNLGVMAWRRGDTSAALDHFRRSVKGDPIHAFEARNNLAAAHRERFVTRAELDDFEAAQAHLQNVLGVEPTNKAAYENLARLFYDRGRLADPSYLVMANLVVVQAIRVLDKAGTPSADIHNIQGLLRMQDDDLVGALRSFQRATTVDAAHVDANMNIAFISIRFRAYGQAEKALVLAMKDPVHENGVEAHLALAVAKRGLGQFAAAEKLYRRAIALDARDPRAWYNLGILHQDHLAGREAVETKELEALYRKARGHYRKFIAVAEHEGAAKDAHRVEITDAKDRIVIIDDTLQTLEKMKDMQARIEEIERLEAEARAAERERLREKERRAMEQSAPRSDPDPAAGVRF